MSGAAGAVSRIARPKMRGMLADRIRLHLGISLALSFVGAYAYKVIICDKRKAVYAEYYRNLDVDKDFEEKRAKGIFTSC